MKLDIDFLIFQVQQCNCVQCMYVQ